MKLAVFTEFFENDKNSAGRHMTDLVLELSKKSETIDVFTLYAHSLPKDRQNKWPQNVRIHSLGYSTESKTNSYYFRFFVELSIGIRAFLKVLKLRKLYYFDSIIWYSPSIFWGPTIFLISIFKKTKRYLILRDIFPQWAVDLNLIGKNSLKALILRFFERLQYKIADVIAIQTEGNNAYFDNMKYAKNKLTILRTWYDLQENNFEIPENIYSNLPEGKKIILYMGNLGVAQNQETLLDTIKEFKDDSTYHFLLIGLKKSDKIKVVNILSSEDLSNFSIYDSIDQRYVDAVCKIATVGVFSLDKRHTTHNIPGKFLQYLSSGLPVFGLCSESDITDIIQKNKFGKTYTGNDPIRAKKMLKNLIIDIEIGLINKKNLTLYIKDEISTKKAAIQILKKIKEC